MKESICLLYTSINKEDKILNADLQISYSTINGIKAEKIPLIIDKGKLTFVYKIHSEQNPFILQLKVVDLSYLLLVKNRHIWMASL